MITDCHFGVWFIATLAHLSATEANGRKNICWHHLSEDTINQFCAAYCTVGPFLLQQRADGSSVNLSISVRGGKLSMQHCKSPSCQASQHRDPVSVLQTYSKLHGGQDIVTDPHYVYVWSSLTLVVRHWCRHSPLTWNKVCCSNSLSVWCDPLDQGSPNFVARQLYLYHHCPQWCLHETWQPLKSSFCSIWLSPLFWDTEI